MSNIQHRRNTNVAKGSLADIARANHQTLAESFLSCEAVIVIDVSGSMSMHDTTENWDEQTSSPTRYDIACDELAKLQAAIPGKVAVIAFSDHPEFAPGGYPRFIGGGTDMAAALQFIKVADGCNLRLILISDGQPDDPTETLRIAATLDHVDTIFIGREGDEGAEFLRRLSAATGGIATTQATNELTKLGKTVQLLLNAGDDK